MSELRLFRQRSEQAIREKAQRGELRFQLPIGYVWSPNGAIERDPDEQICAAVQSVFEKFEQLGSARQVLHWFRNSGLLLPAVRSGRGAAPAVWKIPAYHAILAILTSPLYSGAYAYGKTENRLALKAGRAEKTAGHRKTRDRWTCLIRANHAPYISWEQYERNVAAIERNTHSRATIKAPRDRRPRSLLAGLLRCRRCGRMLHVAYSGPNLDVPRYFCQGGNINHGIASCISFGGIRVDVMVERQLLAAARAHVDDAVIRASNAASAEANRAQRKSLEIALQEARAEAALAERRYQAHDSDNRLVTAVLELRRNAALERLENVLDKSRLMASTNDLARIWNAPTTAPQLKVRIARILLAEAVADVDEQRGEIVLMLHWQGGQHSELRIPKNKNGSRTKDMPASALAGQLHQSGLTASAMV